MELPEPPNLTARTNMAWNLAPVEWLALFAAIRRLTSDYAPATRLLIRGRRKLSECVLSARASAGSGVTGDMPKIESGNNIHNGI
jgi:hypothetical protein